MAYVIKNKVLGWVIWKLGMAIRTQRKFHKHYYRLKSCKEDKDVYLECNDCRDSFFANVSDLEFSNHDNNYYGYCSKCNNANNYCKACGGKK